MRTMAEIAELLHDAGSHAAGWERILRKRAEAPDTPDQDRERIHEAAENALSGGISFGRYARLLEPRDLPAMIKAVDLVLRAGPVLRETLILGQERAQICDPEGGDVNYLSHEVRALDRLVAAREQIITAPPERPDPAGELEAIMGFAALLGREIQVNFEGGADGHRIEVDLGQVPLEVGMAMGPRISRLADQLIRCEIPNWYEGPGASGRVRISANEDPWLDAVDHAEDWLLERTVDLDTLDEIGWGEDEDADPSP